MKRWLLALLLACASFGAHAAEFCFPIGTDIPGSCIEQERLEREVKPVAMPGTDRLVDLCWTKTSNPPPCPPGTWGVPFPAESAPAYDDLHVDADGKADVVLPEPRAGPILLADQVITIPQPAAAGGPTELAADTFDRAGSADLGADWTPNLSSMEIVSNRARDINTGATNSVESYTGITWPDNQWSEVILATVTAGGAATDGYGVGVRWDVASGNTGYGFVCNAGGYEVFKNIAGVTTSIDTNTTPTCTTADTISLEANGTTLTAKKGVSTVFSGTDASIASGDAAIVHRATTVSADGIASWRGGSL